MDQPLGSRYVLHEMLGRGAMGQVYRASTRESETPLAVKLLKPELVTDPELVARFIQERSILTSIGDPNVVQIFDLVVEGDTLGIVMELIAGRDLRHHLRRQGTLPPAEAAGLTRQILHGVAAVHAAGIIHRDIKPENLLLDTSGGQVIVKLTDFGVARISYGTSLTKRTSLIGTPEYMAPELADGGALTPAADLYSVGIILYEMLGGETPFTGGHPLAVLRRHVDQSPAPIPGIPYELWDYVDWLLAKDPRSRPGSATDAAAALMPLQPRLADLAALPPISAPDPSAAFGPHPGIVPPPATTPAPSTRPPQSTAWPAALGTGHVARPMTAFPAGDNGGTVVRRRDRGYAEDGEGTPIPSGSAPSQAAAATAAAQWAAGQQPADPGPWDQGLDSPWRRASLVAAHSSGSRVRPARGVGSRPMVLALPAAVVILAAAVGFLMLRPHGTASAAGSPVTSYTFAAERYADGLTIVRRWVLSGHDGSQLSETLIASRSRRGSRPLPFKEVIPTAIAASLNTVQLTPEPAILQKDPLVEWRFRVAYRHTETVSYRAKVPADGATHARLARWAADLSAEAARLHLPVPTLITLSSLRLSPRMLTLPSGSAARLTVSGELAKGGRAPAQILAGAAWSTANAAVATVSPTGLVTATGPGTTSVTAQIGPSHATAAVTVTSTSQPPGAAGAQTGSGSGADSPHTSVTKKATKKRGRRVNPSPTVTVTDTNPPGTGGLGTSHAETADTATSTWSDYTANSGNGGGTEGASISVGETVQVSCQVMGVSGTSGDPYWYRLASAPWDNAYYVASDNFYNNGQTSGPLEGSPVVDPNVPSC